MHCRNERCDMKKQSLSMANCNCVVKSHFYKEVALERL